MNQVLIVDDAAPLRALAKRIMEREDDFSVIGEAVDGQEGLEMARKLYPDVVLLDLNMPVRSGLDILPEMRHDLPDATIVVFSGLEETRMGESARRSGADGYIVKGTPPKEIVAEIRRLLEARKAV